MRVIKQITLKLNIMHSEHIFLYTPFSSCYDDTEPTWMRILELLTIVNIVAIHQTVRVTVAYLRVAFDYFDLVFFIDWLWKLLQVSKIVIAQHKE